MLVAGAMMLGVLPATSFVRADPEKYNIWVQGIQVDDDNKTDVLGDGTGSVKYDPELNTLTLENAEIKGASLEAFSDKRMAGIYFDGIDGLKIALVGENKISERTGSDDENKFWYGIKNGSPDYQCTIGGVGSLDIDMPESSNKNEELNGLAIPKLTINGGVISITPNLDKPVGESIGIMGDSITISGGTVTAEGYTYGIFTETLNISGGVVTAKSADADSSCDGVLAKQGLEISGGGLNASGKEYGIETNDANGDLVVKNGVLSVGTGGISVKGNVKFSGGSIDVKNEAGNAISTEGNIKFGSGIKYVSLQSGGTYALIGIDSDIAKIDLSDELMIKDPEDGKLDANKKKIVTKDGADVNYAYIVPKKVTVTWKAGDGTGDDIVEKVDYGSEVYYTVMPSGWTEPEGKHFDGWTWVEMGTYEYCSGGWTPGYAKFTATADATLIAGYKYWIVGWEDTGDNGCKGCCAQERGIKKDDGDVHFDAGENLFLEVSILDGYDLTDMKVEIISAKDGTVLGSINNMTLAHTYTGYVDYSGTYYGTSNEGMPAEDVKLRFATKDQNPGEYTVVSGADGSWTQGSGKDFELTVKRSEDDAEKCFNRFKSVSVDGVELTSGTDYDAKAGSTIVTIKAATLEALSVGSHEIEVTFSDGKALTSITTVEKSKDTTEGDTTTTDGGTTTTDGGTTTTDGGTTTTDGGTTTTDGSTATTDGGTTTTDGGTTTTDGGSSTTDSGSTTTTDGNTSGNTNGNTVGANTTTTTGNQTTTTNGNDNTTTAGNTNGNTTTNTNANGNTNNKNNSGSKKGAKTGDVGATMIIPGVMFIVIGIAAAVVLLAGKKRRTTTEYDDLKYLVRRV